MFEASNQLADLAESKTAFSHPFHPFHSLGVFGVWRRWKLIG